VKIEKQRVVKRPSFLEHMGVDQHKPPPGRLHGARAHPRQQIPRVRTHKIVQSHEAHLSEMQRLCPRRHVEVRSVIEPHPCFQLRPIGHTFVPAPMVDERAVGVQHGGVAEVARGCGGIEVEGVENVRRHRDFVDLSRDYLEDARFDDEGGQGLESDSCIGGEDGSARGDGGF
jgi:hypothetical protein